MQGDTSTNRSASNSENASNSIGTPANSRDANNGRDTAQHDHQQHQYRQQQQRNRNITESGTYTVTRRCPQ